MIYCFASMFWIARYFLCKQVPGRLLLFNLFFKKR